ncbi:MAG: hypothetical protein JNK72_13035 [Myxococcales bacterium]|nr:hypothetical protein [Myxococcales bacterium]
MRDDPMAEHSTDTTEETPEFKLMREYDKNSSGQKFVTMLVVTLAIALTVIYGLASLGEG